MGWNLLKTFREHRARTMMFVCLLTAGLSGCVPGVSLQFSPAGDPTMEREIHEIGDSRLSIVTFSDDRPVPKGSGDPRLIGWGTGTGTLDTRTDIKEFVARSFASEMNRLGIRARWVPVPVRPFGAPEKRVQAYRKFLAEDGLVLLGRIREFQFQVDHPRFAMGAEFSILDMQNARIRVQVEMDLRFVDLGTGDVLWEGILSSGQEKDVHYRKRGQDLKAASALLSDTLRNVIIQASKKFVAKER